MAFDPPAGGVRGVTVPVHPDRVRRPVGVRPLVERPIGAVRSRLSRKGEKALVAEVILLAEVGQRATERCRRSAWFHAVVQKPLEPSPVTLDRRPLDARVGLRDVDVLARHPSPSRKRAQSAGIEKDVSARPANGQPRGRPATARPAHRAHHASPSDAPSTQPPPARGRDPSRDACSPRAP